jgi:tRNA (adenine-N(1)-)-methyltransferase non-catalytic subunit
LHKIEITDSTLFGLFKMDSSCCIKEGDTVILRMHDDKSTCMLKVKGEQKIYKSRIKVTALIGSPYGSIFEIRDRRLERVETTFDDLFESSLADGSGDNSGFIDSNTSQKLTTEDIAQLKENGARGEDILKSLIENSETWSSKTVVIIALF